MSRSGAVWRRFTLSLVLAAVAIFALMLWADAGDLRDALVGFDVVYILPVLAFSLLNYATRFLRWQYYLRAVDVRVPTRGSAGVFYAGLMMSVTPGKLGELIKCFMLRDRDDVPIARSAPVVVAERYTDLVAILVLLGVGAVQYPAGRALFAAGLAAVVVLFVLFTFSERFLGWALRLAGRFVPALRTGDGAKETAEAFRVLLRGDRLAVGTLLGVAAWSWECLGFFLVLRGLGWDVASLFSSAFVYAAATLAGALSMLPGGLLATEASMAALLTALDAPKDVASAATLLIRAATLWFGVVVGLVAYALQRRSVQLALVEVEDETGRDV